MMQYSLLLSNIINNTKAIIADSTFTTIVELKSNPISVKNDTDNWGFILFFISFFIIVTIISKRNKFLLSLFSELYRNKDRHNIFYGTVTNENLNKFFLSLQTIVLLSIIFYCNAVHEHLLSVKAFSQMLLFLGKCSILLIVFLLYKFFTYLIIGSIFFRKEIVTRWNDDFFSLLSLNGIFLFFPTLILFYVESAYFFCVYFLIIYLTFNLFFIFYKLYVLFFQGKHLLIYFILYLCTQEIIPLYLVYRGLVYLIAQKGTIWMQV